MEKCNKGPQNEAEFASIGGLRLGHDQDGAPLARPRRRNLRQDKLLYYGRGVLEIYYDRPTPCAATAAARYWKKRLRKVLDHYHGEYDGLIRFECRGRSDIPRTFLKQAPKGVALQKGLSRPQFGIPNRGV